MNAHDTQIFKYLEGSKCFIVPLFQRTYSWGTKHWETLWSDLKGTLEDNSATHFFGSFVTLPIPSSASEISKYVIIDGQQRLVTISILLAALRKRIEEIDSTSDLKNAIYEQYLTNKFAEEKQDKNKILPTEADRAIFSQIVNSSDTSSSPEHSIVKAYTFFLEKLSDLKRFDDLRELKNTLLNRFSVVDICLDKDDDPYLIFESLNATGEPLTQADLVRNYLFMKISQDNQQEVYDKIWFPMQQKLNLNLEDFFRHYLARGGTIPNFNTIYASLKDRAEKTMKTEKEIVEFMKSLATFSEYYYRFLMPPSEPNGILRTYFEKFNSLEVTTSYPLLLNLYDDYANSRLSLEDFANLLKTIETYIVRRAVCGIPTNVLNRFFPTVYQKLTKEDLVGSFKKVLKEEKGSSRFPEDDDFERDLKQRDLYGTKMASYLLEAIEKYDNKETVDFQGLQIEHVMPQTLSDEWKKELGEKTWELIFKKYLHTLGNLTLTGYNPEYSNKTFLEKRDMEKGFRQSGLRLNRDLAALDIWGEKEISERAERLCKLALVIWSF